MFELVWPQSVVDQLRDLMEAAANPEAIVDAVHELDRMLRDDPVGQSESRPEPDRIAFAPPLGVLFQIVGKRIVIGSVWRIRPV
jgi:hypothetical protein